MPFWRLYVIQIFRMLYKRKTCLWRTKDEFKLKNCRPISTKDLSVAYPIIKETSIHTSFAIGRFWITWTGKIDFLFQWIPESYFNSPQFLILIEAWQVIVNLQKKTHVLLENESYSTPEEKGQNECKQAITEKRATIYTTKHDENIRLTVHPP